MKIHPFAHIYLIFFILFFCRITANSQEPAQDTASVDFLFQKARNLAFNGKRTEARSICRQILLKSPDYEDVRVLLGRTYEWDSKPDSARLELKNVLSKGYYADAASALLDVETWEDRPDSALFYADMMLNHNPNNVEVLIKKAKLLLKKKDEKGAVYILKQILDNIDPANKEAKSLLQSIRFEKKLNRISLGWANEYFDQSSFSNASWLRNWNVYSLEYSRRFIPFGLLQFRTNLGTMNDNALVPKQLSLDAYPGISKRDYLYLGYAYSPDDLYFPRHYAGAEIFHSFPLAFEGSLGFRYLQFHGGSSVSDVVIYTGSASKYFGNYWLSIRAYLTPARDMDTLTNKTSAKISKSLNITVRRYFQTSNDYLYLSVGFGSSPVRNLFADNFYFLSKKQFVTLGYQHVFYRLFIGASVGLYHEQYWSNPDNYRNEIDTSLKAGLYF